MVSMPVPAPFTWPLLFTVAIEVLLLVHTPPGNESVRSIPTSLQISEGPIMGGTTGGEATVMLYAAIAVPQKLVTV